MSGRSVFAPFRIPRGVTPEEASALAAAADCEPMVAQVDDPLPAAIAERSLAEIPVGHTAIDAEACRGADGVPSGAPGQTRACLNSDAHRARIETSIRRALEAGYAGVCLDLPDAALALGVLGSGFCTACQRAFSQELSRDYGDHFQPLDYLALAREALASAPGALTHERLPFGREFWRARMTWLDRRVAGWARHARDLARSSGRPVEVVARFEAIGPAQLRAARHLDAALFRLAAPVQTTGAGLFRLLRAVAGKRPCAVEVGLDGPTVRLAGVASSAGIDLVLADGLPVPPGIVAGRRFARAAAARGRSAARDQPVAECAVLYSGESDLWTGGDHRAQLERVGDALARLQIQAPVVLRPGDAPPGAVLVLAGARSLSLLEAQAVRRRLEAGGGVLCLGAPGVVDEVGRTVALPFPAGKPAGVRVERGTIVQIGELPVPRPGVLPDPRGFEELSRSLQALLGRGRQAVSSAGRAPLHVVLHRSGSRVDAHLATLEAGLAQGATLFVGLQAAGEVRRGRFKSSGGADERIPMNASGYAISTVLPAFEGYAILSLPG